MQLFLKHYTRYKDKDLVVLGLNSTDDRRIATTFLRENVVRFPNILDSSPEARKVVVKGYGNRMNGVPLNYVIDPQGNVMDAWYGYDQGHQRAGKALERLGLEFEGS